MKYSILVVDDDLDNVVRGGSVIRRNLYKALEENFDLVFAEKVDDINKKLKSNKINAILMDFVLDKWGLSDPRALLANIDKRYPVALISANWGPMFEPLRQTLKYHKEQICQFFTWEDISEPERRGLISIWLESAIREHSNFALLDPGPDEPLRILQLSDLHFGGKLPASFGAETDQIAQVIRRHWSTPPDFIALTGDLAHRGLPENYDSAARWIEKLARHLDSSWSAERFLIVPGNHDVCWPLALAARLKIGAEVENSAIDEDLITPSLQKFAVAPFREFARKLDADSQWNCDNQYWVNTKYRHLGVIFFGYNSCELLDVWGRPEQKICDETFSKLMNEIRQHSDDFPNVVLVGLHHHPLFAEDPSDAINNYTTFCKHFTDFRRLVIIVGHTHSSHTGMIPAEGTSIFQIVGPTVTQPSSSRQEDTLRGFNLITFNRKEGIVESIFVDTCHYERQALTTVARVKIDVRDGWLQQRRT